MVVPIPRRGCCASSPLGGRRWRWIALLVLAGAVGCTTYDGNRAWPPFFEVLQDPKDLPAPSLSPAPTWAELTGSRPLREIELPPGRDVVLRPLFSYSNHGPEHRRFLLLWPLADFRRDSGERRQWILPVWYRQIKRDDAGGANDRWMLFPILYGGNVATEGSYFAFFPFAGKIRAILGKREIDFFLFPLYWRSRGNWGQLREMYSLHLFFPFYNRVWGEGWSGWRIWPFWGHYREWAEDGRPRQERRFILWPFFISQRNELNTRRPSRLLFIFPFYGVSENEVTLTRTILWPLFHTTIDKPSGKKTHFGWVIPYRFTEGQFDLWPLFGVKRFGVEERLQEFGGEKRFRQFFLWPIQRYDYQEDERFRMSRLWILPFYWRFHMVRKEEPAEEIEWKVWPLIRYRRTPGEGNLYILSPEWMRQEVPFERLYSRLWRIFLYRDTPDWMGWEVLFNLVSYRNQKRKDVRTFAILGGLFERRSGPDGARYRFFYLPWRSGDD